MVNNYLYYDVITTNPRLFTPCFGVRNEDFIYTICIGLTPRFFDSCCLEQKVILMEDQQVAEILFISTGIVGIGFS